MALQDLLALEAEMSGHFIKLRDEQQTIRRKLDFYADGKLLKGDELVGWLGEIYGKLLFSGTLVPDSEEHDFATALDNMRVSVKTRRGWGGGWNQAGIVPKVSGDTCPTHLMFVHLDDDYSVNRIWVYPWNDLVDSGRFKPKTVRGEPRGYSFIVNTAKDAAYTVYAT